MIPGEADEYASEHSRYLCDDSGIGRDCNPAREIRMVQLLKLYLTPGPGWFTPTYLPPVVGGRGLGGGWLPVTCTVISFHLNGPQ
jgi:hypothetical protein